MYPANELRLFYLPAEYDQHNRPIINLFNILLTCTLVTILLSGLGLYALSQLTVSSRTREVGIRKAIGASQKQISRALLWDQCKPFLYGLLLACPLGYLLSELSLQYLSARISLPVWIFAVVPIAALLIACFTVLLNIRKAAATDPLTVLAQE